MRTLKVVVTDSEYEAIREVAEERQRPIEQLLQEAMTFFRRSPRAIKRGSQEFPLLRGHRPTAELPTRTELVEEMLSFEDSASR